MEWPAPPAGVVVSPEAQPEGRIDGCVLRRASSWPAIRGAWSRGPINVSRICSPVAQISVRSFEPTPDTLKQTEVGRTASPSAMQRAVTDIGRSALPWRRCFSEDLFCNGYDLAKFSNFMRRQRHSIFLSFTGASAILSCLARWKSGRQTRLSSRRFNFNLRPLRRLLRDSP